VLVTLVGTCGRRFGKQARWVGGWMDGWMGGTLEFVGSPLLTHRGRPAAYQAHESKLFTISLVELAFKSTSKLDQHQNV
jgi:hypothetical protein